MIVGLGYWASNKFFDQTPVSRPRLSILGERLAFAACTSGCAAGATG